MLHEVAQLLVLFTSISISWLLGTCGCSFTWMLVTAGFMYSVWRQLLSHQPPATSNRNHSQEMKRQSIGDCETADWLNCVFKSWWSFSSKTLSSLARDQLNIAVSRASSNFFSELKVSSLNLGNAAPTIHSIKFVDDNRPLLVPDQVANHKLVLNAVVNFSPPTFQMTVSCKVRSDWSNVPLLLSVDDLHVSGQLVMSVCLDMDAGFPHVTRITCYFTEKPEVWFSLKLLNVLPLTEIPIIKSYVHTLIMEALAHQMVDPFAINITIGLPGPRNSLLTNDNSVAACGVLTICVEGGVFNCRNKDECENSIIQLGQQERCLSYNSSVDRWEGTISFLVHDMASQSIILKMMGRKFLSRYIMATFELKLSDYPWERQKIVKTNVCDNLCGENGDGFVRLFLVMEYSPLQPTVLDDSPVNSPANDVAGVTQVLIHGAESLRSTQGDRSPNPYCIIYADRQKICVSSSVPNTIKPNWGCLSEFIVPDYTKCLLTVVIHHNDGLPTSDSNMLGVAHVKLSWNEPKIVEKAVPVQRHVITADTNPMCGSLIVSVVFRPVLALSKPDKHILLMEEFILNNFPSERPSSAKAKRKLPSQMSQASSDSATVDSGFRDGVTPPLVDFAILRAKDLISTKPSGFSDPYCEIKIGPEVKFRTTTKCSTVAPVWEENVTMVMPSDEDFLELIIWDRDRLFVKDFLGSVTLGIDEIQKISSQGSPHWFQLQGVPSGHLQCSIKVTPDLTSSVQQQGEVTAPTKRRTSRQESSDSVFDGDVGSNVSTPVKSSFANSKSRKRRQSGADKDRDKRGNDNNNINKRSSSSGSNLSEPIKLLPDHDLKSSVGNATSPPPLPTTTNMVRLSNTDIMSPPYVAELRRRYSQSRGVSFDDSTDGSLGLNPQSPSLSTSLPEHRSLPRTRTRKSPLERSMTSPEFDLRSTRKAMLAENCFQDAPERDLESARRGHLSRSVENSRQNLRAEAMSPTSSSAVDSPRSGKLWNKRVMETNLDDVQLDDPIAHRINIAYEKAIQPKRRSGTSQMRRAGSEPNVQKVSQRRPRLSGSELHRSNREDWAMKKSDSLSSLGSTHSVSADKGSNLSLNITEEKYYYVVGKLLKARGIHNLKGDLYCKIRLDSRPAEQRIQKLSQGKVLGKSSRMKPETVCDFNKSFVVDTGSGVSMDALMIFDVKNTYKEYIASKGLTLKYLIQDQFEVTKWVSLENSVDILLQISHGDPSKVKLVQQAKGPVAKLRRTFSSSNIKDTEL